jgi:zinc/manganese transport system substrate-binding protein
VSIEQRLLSGHRVEAFLYNQQVTDTLTDGFRTEALRGHVPVVAVYETMPPGYDYQSWMLAEVRALRRAVERHLSTEHL